MFCMLKNVQIKWRSPTSQRFGFFRQILNLRENESRNILIFSLQEFWCYVLHSESDKIYRSVLEKNVNKHYKMTGNYKHIHMS